MRPDRLGGVLEHAQTVRAGDRVQSLAVDRQAGKVDRQQQPGARRDRRLDSRQVDVAGRGVDVDEHRRGADASTTLAVATQLNGVVITSSPGPTPATRSAISSAAVAELATRTGRPPT
ncbi:MAG: hypothetical protein V9G18_15220 [Albidovulum sp.]